MSLLEKLKSRKFWLAIICVIVGIVVVAGVSTDQIETTAQAIVDGIKTFSGSAVLLVGAVSYVLTEGKVDAQNILSNVTSMLTGSGETIAGGEEDEDAENTNEDENENENEGEESEE